MFTRIVIEDKHTPPATLEADLREHLTTSEIALELEEMRGIDTAVLVAIVGAAGTAVGALIGGVLNFAAKKGAQQIIIQGKNGRKLEIPVDTSEDRLAELVAAAKDLDVDRILI